MTKTDNLYQKSRDVWDDWNHRQEFEHILINRKTSWLLTTQTILFAAYGLTLGSNAVDKSVAKNIYEFRKVVASAGFAVAAVTLVGIVGLIISKFISFREYSEFYELPYPTLDLPGPLRGRKLQWGVRTHNTWLTLAPDVLLPIIFAGAWLYLLGQLMMAKP
jgi:hypothetical protein